jgi:hypothetical protein
MKNGILLIPKGQFAPLSEITFENMISSAVNFVLIVASVLFVFNFLIGGIKFMLSGGNREKLDSAKRQLLNAILGIIIIFSSWAVLGFIGEFFGVDFSTFQIPTF